MSTAAREPAPPAPWIMGYVCGACGYGIRVAPIALPACPMCRAESWAFTRDERPSFAD